jgi:hypothetical protein
MISNTRKNWRRRFKRCSPISYRDAIHFDAAPDLEVTISLRTDIGIPVYAIVLDDERFNTDDFWMDACKTEEQAKHLCDEMGWKY